MENESIHLTIARAMVNEFIKDPCGQFFCSYMNVTTDQLVDIITVAPKTKRRAVEFTPDLCHKLLGPEFDERWIGDGQHCIVILSSKYANSPEELYTYCGKEVEGKGITCLYHASTAEGKKLNEDWIKGVLNLINYRTKKTKGRCNIASQQLKRNDDIPLYKRVEASKTRMPFFKYTHIPDCRYNRTLGIVIIRKEIDGIDAFATVGVDKNNTGRCRKLGMEHLKAIKAIKPGNGPPIIVELDTVDPKTRSRVEKKKLIAL